MGVCSGGRVRIIVIEDNEDTSRRVVVNNYDLQNTFSTQHVDEYTDADYVEGVIQLLGFVKGTLSADNKTITIGDIQINANEVMDFDDPEAGIYENYGLVDGFARVYQNSTPIADCLIYNGQIAVLVTSPAYNPNKVFTGDGILTNKLGLDYNLDSLIRDAANSLATSVRASFDDYETLLMSSFDNEVIIAVSKWSGDASGFKSLPLRTYNVEI